MGTVTPAGWVVLFKDEPIRWFKREAWAIRLQQKLGPMARRAEVYYSSALTE